VQQPEPQQLGRGVAQPTAGWEGEVAEAGEQVGGQTDDLHLSSPHLVVVSR